VQASSGRKAWGKAGGWTCWVRRRGIEDVAAAPEPGPR
jgi:hypothetical protein